MNTTRGRHAAATAAALLSLVVVACGKGADEAPEVSATPPPTTTTSAPPDEPVVADVAPATAEDTSAGSRFYRGKVDLPGGVVLSMNITITGDGGTIDIPLQHVEKAPLHDVLAGDDAVSFAFRPPGAPEAVVIRFSAKRDAGSGPLVGELDQMGTKLPLKLEPVASAEAFVLRRPQTPAPPWPYDTETMKVAVDGAELACTLSTPKGDGPHPAVVFFTGSGAQDRDETIFEHKPFLVISHALVQRGVATLRCDDRGVGESTGDLGTVGHDAFVADGAAMVDALAKRPDIDGKRVGVLGHSEGGIVVAELLARDKTAFGVMLAGPALSGREVSVRQNLEALLRQGVSKEKAHAVEKAVDDLFGAMVEGKGEAERHARARVVAEAVMAAGGFQDPTATVESLTAQFVLLTQNPWLESWVKSEPAPLLAKASAPVLAVYGEMGRQVHGADHAAALKKAFEEAKKKDGEVELVTGVNHLFQSSKTGDFSEYEEIEETIQPSVLERVVSWIEKQVGK